MSRKRGKGRPDPAAEAFEAGRRQVAAHPMLSGLLTHSRIVRGSDSRCPPGGWAVVTRNGTVHVHPTRRGTPQEWLYVLAHCLLHLGFGHFQGRRGGREREWNAACDVFIGRFLADLKLGRQPDDVLSVVDPAAGSEDTLYALFCAAGLPREPVPGTAGPHAADMIWDPLEHTWGRPFDWEECFGAGLARAASTAVNIAAGIETSFARDQGQEKTTAQRAKAWFVNSYPLLGALAASFEVIEDPQVCHRLDISVAAVDIEAKEIFVNPAAGLSERETRFVMAHELLHAGLRHDVRCQGRDHYLWNVACDYVINAWLVEMGVGDAPSVGLLYDPALKADSAEAVYDRVVTDLRRFRRLQTMRGYGSSDILERGAAAWWTRGAGVDLDGFYRRALGQGLHYHHEHGRGVVPGGLVEEIRALSQPPIPWDVELAAWFADHFPAIEKVRSWARLSRHQSATPDTPRPQWVPPPDWQEGRTFGVVLDTSGSMDRSLLAKALGAIASYSMARDVPAARVVFCDAVAYDQGYMPPEAIAERVRVRGRGGTVLRPGVELLQDAEDFPKRGPILIITDGVCDVFAVRREHAFLMPAGRTLPFVARGPVFRIS